MSTRVTLTRTTPEAQGVSSHAMLAFLDDVERNIPELHSLMLVRHGSVIAEGWWAPYAPQLPHMLFSLSKSFTSTAIGMAVDEKRLTVDDFVLSFFPEEAPSGADAHLQAMRVRHLLSMSTGHAQDASDRTFAQRNWVKAFLSLPVEHEPGTFFCYNTAATYMLSAILQKLTGEKLLDYLRPRLFQPLGITGASWQSCPLHINTGGFGLKVRTEDIARLGLLYLNQGLWHGQRLLSEAWIAEATARQVPNGENPDSDWNQGYGYQFWRCRHNCYRGDGAFGQYCLVLPEQDAVLAITAGTHDLQGVLTKVWDTLLPGMAPAPLLPDLAAQTTLSARLAGLRFDPPAGAPTAALAARVSGRKILFAPNDLHAAWAQFDFAADSATLTIRTGRRIHVIPCGVGAWQYGITSAFFRNPRQKVAASGIWSAPDTFQLTLRYYETPFYHTITCRFTDSGASLQMVTNVSFGPTEGPTLVGHFSLLPDCQCGASSGGGAGRSDGPGCASGISPLRV